VPKSLDERMVEEERNETLYKAVGSLPEIQRRRFLLYYEYEFNFYQIAAMEHCTASAIQKSVAIAKEKVKAEIEEISPTMTDTARKRNLFFICVGLAALHTLTFFRGSKSIFKEVNAYVQRKQRHRPKGGKPCRSYRQSTPKRSFMNRLRNHPLWWTALSRQAYRCSAAHRR
jgi:RNA polymerase sigma-70 factor (ECF subfamily)